MVHKYSKENRVFAWTYTIFRRNSRGVIPFSFAKRRLKVRMEEKPAPYAASVMPAPRSICRFASAMRSEPMKSGRLTCSLLENM